jgi:prepilin-type N-terminal cleavage/methylation domain-containing protein
MIFTYLQLQHITTKQRARTGITSGSPKRAMTLTELLIVISIIVMLGTLVIPLIGFIKTHARQTACQNNLRQIGAAMHVYAGLHGGLIPGSKEWVRNGSKSIGWFDLLPPLMGERDTRNENGSYWQCPQYNGKNTSKFAYGSPKSYKMNLFIDHEGEGKDKYYSPYQFGLINDASDVVLMFDAITTGTKKEPMAFQYGHGDSLKVDDSRHFGWISVLYADGRTTRAQNRSSQSWEKALQWTSQEW